MTQYSGKVIRKTPVTPTQQSASGVWKLNEQAAAIRNNSWPVPGVPDPISRSVRFRASASAYLNRTPSVASNRKTWTWSGWIKRGLISGSGTYEIFMGDNYSTSFTGIRFYNDAVLVQDYVSGSKNIFWQTNGLLRDPAAWYHVVVKYDTTQASSTNSVLIYVNGVSQALTFTANTGAYVQNYDGIVNSTNSHKIGTLSTLGNYFDGYMTEVNFIDGQALTPSSFGTTDTATGAWIPMAYTGTYGTNGFYLNFKDNTSTTTIGYDYSGNANNWTANNISLTAGSTYDSMLDVPTPWVGYSTTTDTSAVTRGNYCTLNAVSTGRTLSEGNLNYAAASSGIVKGTIGVSSGKWYWEVTAGNGSPTSNSCIGICDINLTPATSFLGNTSNSWGYAGSATKYNNGTGASYGASYASGDIIGVAFDADAGTLTFYKNNVSQGQAYSGITGSSYCPAAGNNTLNDYNGYHNFGQRPFIYTPPTGYKALVTTNLPTPAITNGANYMAASTYTGTGALQSIVNSGNNTAAISFQPDFVWIKDRSAARSHRLFDSVRGATKALFSDATDAETTLSTDLTAFNSNGFALGAGLGSNANTETFVGWQWKASGTTSSNTSGSITSTVSVNTTAGFSIVTYTGTGANATVGHGLGVAPQFFVVKPRSTTGSWIVYATALGSPNLYTVLNATADPYSAAPTVWNSTAPTSSVFSIGTASGVNTSTTTYVAYCWAAVAGFSAFGSYTGNDSADGPFVYCGFRPRWIMFKNTTNSGSWVIFDTSRDTYNVEQNYLFPNQSTAENGLGSVTAQVDYLSNGFKIRANNANAWMGNQSGSTFIYAAFAENPFKYSNAR